MYFLFEHGGICKTSHVSLPVCNKPCKQASCKQAMGISNQLHDDMMFFSSQCYNNNSMVFGFTSRIGIDVAAMMFVANLSDFCKKIAMSYSLL